MADTTRRPLVAGNWKMNGLKASAVEFDEIIAGGKALLGATDLMVCPPATLLLAFVGVARGSGIAIGGQDCHAQPAGAYTGDISADMRPRSANASRKRSTSCKFQHSCAGRPTC